jgi:hypothetical protein
MGKEGRREGGDEPINRHPRRESVDWVMSYAKNNNESRWIKGGEPTRGRKRGRRGEERREKTKRTCVIDGDNSSDWKVRGVNFPFSSSLVLTHPVPLNQSTRIVSLIKRLRRCFITRHGNLKIDAHFQLELYNRLA